MTAVAMTKGASKSEEQAIAVLTRAFAVDHGTDHYLDVTILGVGTASPRVAAAIAGSLDVPIESIVGMIYRAPASLATGLEATVAQKLVDRLQALGLAAEAVPAGTPVPTPTLYDVAAELLDPVRSDDVAASLGGFLGVAPEAALSLLLTPPGVFLGSVSRATIEALERVLPLEAVRLSYAEPARSDYVLFDAGLSPAQRRVLSDLLGERAVRSEEGGITAFGLSYAEAESIWRQLRSPETLRIVNQAFLRFELLLQGTPADGAPALNRLAGVPEDVFDELSGLLPVPVEDDVPFAAVEERLAAYRAEGFLVEARMTTFASQALEILAGPPAALATCGLTRAELPVRMPPMPLPRARLVRTRLEAAGAEVVVA